MGEGVGGPKVGVGWGPLLPGSEGGESQGRPDSEPGGGAGGAGISVVLGLKHLRALLGDLEGKRAEGP